MPLPTWSYFILEKQAKFLIRHVVANRLVEERAGSLYSYTWMLPSSPLVFIKLLLSLLGTRFQYPSSTWHSRGM